MTARSHRKPELPVLVKVLRGIIGLAAACGVAGFSLTAWYWPSVTCIYASFAHSVLDVWLEPGLRARSKIVFVLLIGGLVLAFSFGMVFVSAPLTLSAFAVNPKYPPGMVIGGIPWRPEFGNTRVSIQNPTSNDYEDLILVMQPHVPVADVAQVSDISGVRFENRYNIEIPEVDLTRISTGETQASPIELLATDVGKRVLCANLHAGSTLEIVLAVVSITKDPPDLKVLGPQEVLKPDFWMHGVSRAEGEETIAVNFWHGYKTAPIYDPVPVLPDHVEVSGSYIIRHRKRWISENVKTVR
jgi:hypothetical protein